MNNIGMVKHKTYNTFIRRCFTMSEIWKPVVNYEGLYEISNLGSLRSCEHKVPVSHRGYNGYRTVHQQICKTGINKFGYEVVKLCKNRKYKQAFIHRLVAQAFIPNPDDLPQVNHIDENKLNNCADNLEWCTRKYNCNYGTRNTKVSNSRKGMQFTDAHRENLRKAHKAIVTDEFREKMRNVHLGTRLTEEHKRKISEGVKRRYIERHLRDKKIV